MGPGLDARQDKKSINTIKELKTMKKILTSAIAIFAMVGCTSDDFVGDKELQRQNEDGAPISFNLVSAPPTRANQTGAEAAGSLNNNFVVYGLKTLTSGTPATQVVFNNYQANYVDGSAATTTSNSVGWEYVGYTNVPSGVTTNVGVTAFATSSDNTNGLDQSIKYWDYNASKYEFFGYSLGYGDGAATPTYATATALTPYSYTLSGNQAQLSACYISDLLTKTDMSATNTQVKLQFRKMESKVKIALYETIPGYSVKDVKFYQSATATTPGTTAYLYDNGTTASLPNEGQFVVSYTPVDPASTGQTAASVTWTAATGGNVAYVSFGDSDPANTGTDKWTNWTGKEYQEETGSYLGRTSSTSTISESQSVLPNPAGTVLNLKVDFTLVAIDGYGETIEVKGATATVPAAYAQWQPNCSYTYLFKISDDTNAQIGGITGLHPITLDAAVITDASGKQETITTVATPSITTYQKGSEVLTNNEYKAGTIYVVVGDGTTALTGTNAKLYTASVTLADGAVANITEASVANAIANPTAPKDANGNPLTVNEVLSGLESITSIPADDAPHGVALTVNGAKFTAAAGTTYVFEYIQTDNTDPSNPVTTKYYKVIKVASGS